MFVLDMVEWMCDECFVGVKVLMCGLYFVVVCDVNE